VINKFIIQIVPQLPPAINGVGDYALNLARQLRQDWGIETDFIVGDPHWQGSSIIEGFKIKTVNNRTAKALTLLLSNNSNETIPILLHYVGYGYQKRGYPFWLTQGLEECKKKQLSSQILTMFHEVSAFSPYPWHSSFWLSEIQKYIAFKLTKLSNHCLTSNEIFANSIIKLNEHNDKKLIILPVFSNIGEPKNIPSLRQRDRHLVIFGSRNSRIQVYQECLTGLLKSCQCLKITEIYDIGISTGINFAEVLKIPVIEKGVLPTQEISQILLNSVAGFINFPPADYLAKSTIFAALCAHGVLPIISTGSDLCRDGLQVEKNYKMMNSQTGLFTIEEGQAIAEQAYIWYKQHNLSAQARIFAGLLVD